ncbi:hypothetical protein NESM_000221500 [Novymonas esmeraldas]|uniref:Uncharacterized protein n=1 Tax=Novymonas esmeraldas TaxID=1808958 RepID=A0AAW0F6X9_9TRYP
MQPSDSMRSQTLNEWESVTEAADNARRIGSSSMGLFTDNSGGSSERDTRSASRAAAAVPAQGKTRAGAASHGQRLVQRDTGPDASPPPRLPLAYATGNAAPHTRRAHAASEELYEEMEEEGEIVDEESWEDEEDEEYEEEEEEDVDRAPPNTSTGRSASDSPPRGGARVLRFDSVERTTVTTVSVRVTENHASTAAPPAPPLARSPPSRTTAAVAATHTFRRATPVARAAYSVGYNAAAGESSESPPSSAAPPVSADNGTAHRTATAPMNTTTTTAMDPPHEEQQRRAETIEIPLQRSSVVSRTGAGRSAEASQTSVQMSDTPHSTGEAKATHVSRSPARPSSSFSAFTSLAPEKSRRGSAEPPRTPPALQPASTSSSPLSPQRPTVCAWDAGPPHHHSGRESASCSTDSTNGDVSSPVIALDDVPGKSRDTTTYSDAARPTRVPQAVARGTHMLAAPLVITSTTTGTGAGAGVSVGHVSIPRGKPSMLSGTGHSRTVEDLLAVWRDTTPALDIAKSACEREGHTRTSSIEIGSPMLRGALESAAASPLPIRQSPFEVGSSSCEDSVADATALATAALSTRVVERASRRQVRSASCRRSPPGVLTVALTVSVTNIYNSSEAQQTWLRGGSDHVDPATAPPHLLPATYGSTAPPAAPPAPVRVALYCRPLLVQLPRPTLHTTLLLCAAENSLVMRAAVVVLYRVPCVLVPRLLRTLARLVMALVLLVVLLLALDAALDRWPTLVAHVAETQRRAAPAVSAAREWIAARIREYV